LSTVFASGICIPTEPLIEVAFIYDDAGCPGLAFETWDYLYDTTPTTIKHFWADAE
jgi:hypothetical protein